MAGGGQGVAARLPEEDGCWVGATWRASISLTPSFLPLHTDRHGLRSLADIWLPDTWLPDILHERRAARVSTSVVT